MQPDFFSSQTGDKKNKKTISSETMPLKQSGQKDTDLGSDVAARMEATQETLFRKNEYRIDLEEREKLKLAPRHEV